MTVRFKHQWLIVILLGTLTSVAQQPAPGRASDTITYKPLASGTLGGHVYLSDTKGPARRVTVYLQAAASLQLYKSNVHDQGQTGAVTVAVQTHFDGSFLFNHVPPGDYYVIASCPGYVSPYLALSLAEGQFPDANQQPLGPSQLAARETVLKSIPRITIQSGQPATVDLTLERGAAISGNISYDDGMPAAGLTVSFLARMPKDGKEAWAEPSLSFRNVPVLTPTSTDDRGNYRINGLPAGKYIIATTFDLADSTLYFSSGSSGASTSRRQWTPLKIYSGNTRRLKDAAALSLMPGEEYSGEDLLFPISKLHTITGHIISAHDGHVINSGQVDLYNSDDKSLAGTFYISGDDPDFTFNFIYDGEYTLSSPNSADVDYQLLTPQPGGVSSPIYNPRPRQLYGYASKPLHVDGDMDGVTIAVPEPTTKKAQMLNHAIEQQEHQTQSSSPSIEKQ